MKNLYFCILFIVFASFFVGCKDTIRLIEITNELIIKKFKGHNGFVNNIIKIIHPKYGESLLSQNYLDSNINLWSNKI